MHTPYISLLFGFAFLGISLTEVPAQIVTGGEPPSVRENIAHPSGGNFVTAYSPIRLTNDSAGSYKPRVAVDETYLYVVWEDTRDDNREIYWQKFNRQTAASAAGPIRVSTTAGVSVEPAIGIDGAACSYIVWLEGEHTGTVYGTKLDANGEFLTATLPKSLNMSMKPSIAVVADGTSFVAYQRSTTTDKAVYLDRYNASFDRTCSHAWLAGGSMDFDKEPAVAASSSSDASLVWRDQDASLLNGIWVGGMGGSCETTDFRRHALGICVYPSVAWGGASYWMTAADPSGNVHNLYGTSSASRVNDVNGTASHSRVGGDTECAYVVWTDMRDGNSEIYLSQANGNTPFADVRVTNDAQPSNYPDIACYAPEPGKLWIVWQDYRDGNWEIYLTASTSVGLCQVAITGDINAEGTITSGDIIYLVNFVFRSGPDPLLCAASGDVNCSGSITSADVIYLVNYVFKSSSPPCDVCTLIPSTWNCAF